MHAPIERLDDDVTISTGQWLTNRGQPFMIAASD
jgi:hypothetical protein